MFGFIKNIFFTAMRFSSYVLNAISLNVNPLKHVSMNNQECRIRTKMIDINSNELSFYPFSISVNKCSGS